jgi:hypothetical protein
MAAIAMKIGILTSIDTRHRYFVQALRAGFDVTAVGYEQTGYDPAAANTDDLSPREARIVQTHFEERARRESEYFGSRSDFVGEGRACAVTKIKPGGLNAPAILELLRVRQVDTVVVYGTNLIKPPLLTAFPGRTINMHLGLSPYYRGTATNFYPLLNEEPEYVGATIHLIDAGIDSGPIVRHAQPEIVAGDGPHTIGCKAILAGIKALAAGLEELDRGQLVATPQWKPARARLYLRKDYHPRQVVELYHKLETGLIERYLDRRWRGLAEVRLVGASGSYTGEDTSSRRANAAQVNCDAS